VTESGSSGWVFGGPLAELPPAIAWTLLAIVAIIGVVLVWTSYRRSVRPLKRPLGIALALLRLTLVGVLLLCLANPVRVERSLAKTADPSTRAKPRLAVVVDRSDSMTQPDSRNRSRLDDARTNWRRIEAAAQKHFGATRYFSLAEDLRPANSLDDAAARSGATNETRLYRSLATLLNETPAERPDAVVVLTDGVDTSSDPDTLLRDAAMATGVPVYFVPGSNRSARPEPFVRVREWRIPPTALPNSEFSLEATVETYSRADRKVPFSLWQSGRVISRGEFELTRGPNLVSRSFVVSASVPGQVEFALRIGSGDTAPFAARGLTEVLPPREKKIRVLVYQTALDWGLRYFTQALRTDPAFEFSTFVTPDLGLTISGASQPGAAKLGQLPEDAKSLAEFDCVVLVRVDPARITPVQQTALVDFARKGGCVLFMSPDATTMPRFAESPLLTLLPVELPTVMQAPPTAPARPPREVLINQITRSAKGAPSPPMEKLTQFALTESGQASPIFARAATRGAERLTPRFRDYVPLHRAKPGTEVLAVHPTGKDASSGKPHILLAVQQFGSGRSALLTTDTLWRWKMDEPSESHAVATFWQQLLLAIGRQDKTGSLRFLDTPAQVRVGQPTALKIGGVAHERLPAVTAKAPDGRSITLPVKRTEDGDPPWASEWTPDRAGVWEISAAIQGANPAIIFPAVMPETNAELAQSLPAIEGMRALARETGGALLSHEAPPAWSENPDRERQLEPATHTRAFLRWNNWYVLSGMLGCFALELILRRLWKLL
jgi:hypothetical protein